VPVFRQFPLACNRVSTDKIVTPARQRFGIKASAVIGRRIVPGETVAIHETFAEFLRLYM
jgi:hypothetical protein